MDQLKIGRFISERRKKINMTQIELAEKLNITDRAISKWENGVCLPDAGIMSELCNILNITINDLFSGEKVDMKENEKKLEENLLEMTKRKEEKDKQLLRLEIIIGYISSITFIVFLFTASYLEMPIWLRMILILLGGIIFALGVGNTIKIEQVAGYYECSKCHHKYVPTYNSVFWAIHMGRKRYMKCPKCSEKSWNKKVLTK